MNTLDRLSASTASDFGDHHVHDPVFSERASDSIHNGSDDLDFDQRAYHVRSATPSSWYLGLATAPPRAEDFLVYDDDPEPTPPPESHLAPQPDPDDWIRRLHAQKIEVFDKLPSTDELVSAGELPVYDSKGTPYAFKSLYRGPASQGARQLVVLIRHIFCKGCQSYVRQLSETLAQSDPSDPDYTSVTLISCSSYKVIDQYRQYMSDKFRIFADPSRKLFRALGCKAWSLSFGPVPLYMAGQSKTVGIMGSLLNYTKKVPKMGLNGGSLFQIGGEFLFENGELFWCHRMRRVFDHAEMSTIKQVLGVCEDDQTRASTDPNLLDDEASVSQDSCQMVTAAEMQRIEEALEAMTLEGSTLRGSDMPDTQDSWVWDPNRDSIFGYVKPRKKSLRALEANYMPEPFHFDLDEVHE